MVAELSSKSGNNFRLEIESLRARLTETESKLAEAQELIRAIQSGDVDAVVVSGPQGEQVFTLRDAEYAYRALVEDMNEGAATLGADGTVLYCNQRLSDLLAIPLEQIIGNPVAKLIPADAAPLFDALIARVQSGEPGKVELHLQTGRGNRIPVYISLRLMQAIEPASLCMVVADISERKQTETELEKYRNHLEELVRERTGQLAAANAQLQADIAQREQVEQSLRESEERFRIVQELSPDGFTILRPVRDNQGRIIDFTWVYENAAIARMNGTDPKEVLGKRLLELFPGHRGSPFLAAYQQAAETGEQIVFEGEYTAEKLPASWYRVVVVRLGQDIAILAQDITERKRTEHVLRRQAELLRLAFDAIILWRLDGGIENWNVGAERLYGFSESEAVGRSTHELLSTVFPRPWPEIRAILLEQGFWEGELRHRTRDGREIIVSARKQLVRDSSGTAHVLEINRDITERKRADDALRASEARFRAFFETAAVGTSEVDLSKRFVEANDRFCRITGYSLEELLRMKPSDLTHPEDRGRDDEQFAKYLRGESPLYETEKRYIRKDGGVIWVSVTAALIRDAEGNPLRSAGVIQDITERKQAEQALLRSEKLASVGRMAATIAHEINNPLETIGHALYLASTDRGSSEQAKSYLELASQELERITHVTKQTLAFHREAKAPVLHDLRESVDGVLKLFAARMKSRQIAVEKRYAEVEPVPVYSGEVQQMISNLLSNSMDAVPNHGKIYLRVSPAAMREGARGVRFTIADTGSGIPREAVKKLFEPFFTTKEMIGTGLGLWVSKQIADKHGASIRVRSKPGQGTVFSIVFPAAGIK